MKTLYLLFLLMSCAPATKIGIPEPQIQDKSEITTEAQEKPRLYVPTMIGLGLLFIFLVHQYAESK